MEQLNLLFFSAHEVVMRYALVCISAFLVTIVAGAQTRFQAPWSARIAAMFDGPGSRDVAIDVDGNMWRYTAGDRTWSWRPASYPKDIRRGISMTPESGVIITSSDDVCCVSLSESIQRWKMSVPSIRDIDTQFQHVVMYVGDSVVRVTYDGQVALRERIPDVVKVRYSPNGATWITSTGKVFRNESGNIRSELIPILDSVRSAYLDDTIAVVVTSTACAVLDITDERFARLRHFFALPDSSLVHDACVVRLSPDEIATSVVVSGKRRPFIININRGLSQTDFFPDSPITSDLPLVFSSPSSGEINVGFGGRAGIVRLSYQTNSKRYRITQQSQSGSNDRIRTYRRFDDDNEIAIMECRPPYLPLVEYTQIVVVSRRSRRLRWWGIVENSPSLATYAIQSPDVVTRTLVNECMVIDSTGMHTVLRPPGADTMYATSNLALALGVKLSASTNGGNTWYDIQNTPGTPIDIRFVHPLGFLVRVYESVHGLRWYQYSQGRYEYVMALSKASTLASNLTGTHLLFVADAHDNNRARLALVHRDRDTQALITLEDFAPHTVQPTAHFDGMALIASAVDMREPRSIELKVFDGERSTEKYQTDVAWRKTPIVGLGVGKDSIYIVYESTDVIAMPRMSTTTHLHEDTITPESQWQQRSHRCDVYSVEGGRYIVAPDDAVITVVDVTGRRIPCQIVRTGTSTQLAVTDTLPAGLYIVNVVTSGSCQESLPLLISR